MWDFASNNSDKSPNKFWEIYLQSSFVPQSQADYDPKHTLSDPHWIWTASFHCRVQSSLADNLPFKRTHLYLIPQMELHGFRSYHISILNPKWQKILSSRIKSCFATISGQNQYWGHPIKEFQDVFNSNQWDNWKLLSPSVSTDMFVPLFWSISYGGQAIWKLEKLSITKLWNAC